MDKGIKKIQKHIEKIESCNKTIVDKAIKKILKLKRHKLSSISTNLNHIIEILIHKDTNNFPILKQKLLAYFNEIHDLYPFLTIGFDTDQSNGNHRKLKTVNCNRLLLTINWNSYMRTIMQETGEVIDTPVAKLGLEQQFEDMKIRNLELLKHAIKDALSRSQELSSQQYTNFNVVLRPNTMSYEITREHFMIVSRKINQQYKGIIEIINVGTDDKIILRVHWNIYLDQISAQSKSRQDIDLDSIDIPVNIESFSSPSQSKDVKLDDHIKYPPVPNDEPQEKKKVKVRKKILST